MPCPDSAPEKTGRPGWEFLMATSAAPSVRSGAQTRCSALVAVLAVVASCATTLHTARPLAEAESSWAVGGALSRLRTDSTRAEARNAVDSGNLGGALVQYRKGNGNGVD